MGDLYCCVEDTEALTHVLALPVSQRRAKLKEMTYEEYESFLLKPVVRKKRAAAAEAEKPKNQ